MSFTNIHIPKRLLSKRKSLMMHGVGFVTGDPTIKLSYPYTFHPGMQITVTQPGNSKWIYMALPLQKNSLITDISIAYHKDGLNNHISHVRLVEQKEPVSATVVHNETFDNSRPTTGVISSGCSIIVKRSILLKVCMNFSDTDEIIEIGSVEIKYIPSFVKDSGINWLENERKKRISNN